MEPSAVIRSRAHPGLKRIAKVRGGKEPALLVLEGDRLVDDALAGGLTCEALFVAESREPRAAELEQRGLPVRRVADELLARSSALVTSPGLLALVHAPRPGELEVGPRTLVLAVAGVSDPGNLGALARSAEAAGAAALAVVRGGASPWNEKALRGSMGSLLRLPVLPFETAAQAARMLADRGLRSVRAATRGGLPLERFDWSGPIALWVGSETGQLFPEAGGFERVTIPMAGAVESLNVTVAAALLLFAAGRNQERA